MAQVVLLRGVNVGGHRTFRPSQLAAALGHLDVVSIGAAGTFVVHAPVGVAELRAEFAQRLPFDTEIVICQGREVAGLVVRDWFASYPPRPDVMRFASLLARAPRAAPRLPLTFPDRDPWLLRVIAREGRFLVGVYKRQMKAIGYLGDLDRAVGVPVTTRNWNTMGAIARALER